MLNREAVGRRPHRCCANACGERIAICRRTASRVHRPRLLMTVRKLPRIIPVIIDLQQVNKSSSGKLIISRVFASGPRPNGGNKDLQGLEHRRLNNPAFIHGKTPPFRKLDQAANSRPKPKSIVETRLLRRSRQIKRIANIEHRIAHLRSIGSTLTRMARNCGGNGAARECGVLETLEDD